MYIARCVFENDWGYSKPYSYRINQRQRMELKKGDMVVVSRSGGGYSVAFIDSVDIIDPAMADKITQHVCCMVSDDYSAESVPVFIEKKNRRVQLLLQPSVHEAIRRLAEDEETSFNDYVNTLLKKHAVKTLRGIKS